MGKLAPYVEPQSRVLRQTPPPSGLLSTYSWSPRALEPARSRIGAHDSIPASVQDRALHPERSKQRPFRLTRITLLVPQREKRALRQIDLDVVKRPRSQRR